MLKNVKKLLLVTLVVTMSLFCVSAYARSRTYEADIVVVGAGGSGLAASVSAAMNGAKVITLEKRDVAGGATTFAEGLFAVGTDETRIESTDISINEAFEHSMEANHWRANGLVVRKFISESANTINWLKDFGLTFETWRMSPNEPRVWHVVKHYKDAEHGAAYVLAMLDKCKELGVKIMYETPASELIIENGVIKGVIAKDSRGNKVTIKAKAVILATGGFSENDEMIAKYTRYEPGSIFPTVPLEKTGDGLKMALQAGAQLDDAGLLLMMHPGTYGPGFKPFGHLDTMTTQPLLWVNKYGERVIDNKMIGSIPMSANAIYRQDGHYVWSIWDEDTIEYYKTKGLDVGLGVIIKIGTKITNTVKEIKDCIKAGSKNVAMADTLEKLAKQMEIDPKALKVTIDRYNSMKDRNEDTDFGTPVHMLKYIKKTKFYAVKVFPSSFISIGGPKINTKMQVISKNNKTVAGLYSIGCDAGGLHSDTYTLWTSGAGFGFAATSGRIAGATAAKYSKNK